MSDKKYFLLKKESTQFHEIKRWNSLGFFYKPPGLLSHQSMDKSRQSFLGQLESIRGESYTRLVNRLDKETSGLILVCFDHNENQYADEILRVAKKDYLLMVKGTFKKGEIEAKHYLKEDKRGMKAVRSGGKPALTSFKLLGEFPGDYSLIRARLITGRRHQIRVQAKELGVPILGDHLYGSRGFENLHLHSFCLSHADFGKVYSPLPYFWQSYPGLQKMLQTVYQEL